MYEMKLERLMHDAGFTHIWYAHPGPKNFRWRDRWHAGVWTGPHADLLCVKKCDTKEEAEKWLSPGSSTIDGAIKAAVCLLEKGDV
jgi:hypothetical protein